MQQSSPALLLGSLRSKRCWGMGGHCPKMETPEIAKAVNGSMEILGLNFSKSDL